jgi:hypothetical protein
MKRRSKPALQEENPRRSPRIDPLVQIKVRLLGISPMVWRRVLERADCTMRGHPPHQFHLRAARYGSWELSVSSPDVSLAALQLRKGARFVCEYGVS